jgi:predicted dehydrogenase
MLNIITAAERSGAKLMIACRLHFEPATIAAIEKVRSGKLGHAHVFSSDFSQMVDTSNHRVLNGLLAGPIFDMGTHPINGIRKIFGGEPLEAFATASRHPDSGFKDLDDTFCVILRFPEGRLAHFSVSYYANALNSYTISGTEGSLEVNPGYTYGKPLEHLEIIGQDKSNESFKNTDHFGGELKYFSDLAKRPF